VIDVYELSLRVKRMASQFLLQPEQASVDE